MYTCNVSFENVRCMYIFKGDIELFRASYSSLEKLDPN